MPLQSIQKAILRALGLARAGSWSGAVFGLAPCFYCIGRVKSFRVLEDLLNRLTGAFDDLPRSLSCTDGDVLAC